MSSGDTRLVAGLLRRDGRVLLCRRRSDRVHFPGVWDLPGGHVHDTETTAEALVRELGEELGVVVASPNDGPWAMLRGHGLELSVFLVDRWQGAPSNCAVDEHDEIRWVGIDELSRLDLADASYAELLKSSLRA